MKKLFRKKEQELRHIADMLLVNGTLVDCPGLLHGKVGVAVFFCHYAKQTKNGLFIDYTIDLIEVLQEQIHANYTADYECGIAGIGVGIDFLIRNNFLEANEDIFNDFDKRMYRAVMYDPYTDFSMYNGLTGYGRYWLMRYCKHPSSAQARQSLLYITRLIEENLTDIPASELTDVFLFLYDMHQIHDFNSYSIILEQCRKVSTTIEQIFPRLGNSLIGRIVRTYQRNYYYGYTSQGEIVAALRQIPNLDMEKAPVSMGLLTGYAGKGMLRMSALNQIKNSWMFLL